MPSNCAGPAGPVRRGGRVDTRGPLCVVVGQSHDGGYRPAAVEKLLARTSWRVMVHADARELVAVAMLDPKEVRASRTALVAGLVGLVAAGPTVSAVGPAVERFAARGRAGAGAGFCHRARWRIARPRCQARQPASGNPGHLAEVRLPHGGNGACVPSGTAVAARLAAPDILIARRRPARNRHPGGPAGLRADGLPAQRQRSTMVRFPWTITRPSQCQRTALLSALHSVSRPAATRSSGPKVWSTSITCWEMIGPSSSSLLT